MREGRKVHTHSWESRLDKSIIRCRCVLWTKQEIKQMRNNKWEANFWSLFWSWKLWKSASLSDSLCLQHQALMNSNFSWHLFASFSSVTTSKIILVIVMGRGDSKRKECVTNLLLLFSATSASCFFLSIVMAETAAAVVSFPVDVVLEHTLSTRPLTEAEGSPRAPSRLTIRLWPLPAAAEKAEVDQTTTEEVKRWKARSRCLVHT